MYCKNIYIFIAFKLFPRITVSKHHIFKDEHYLMPFFIAYVFVYV